MYFQHPIQSNAKKSGPCRLKRYDEVLVHHLLDSLRVNPPDSSPFSPPLVTVTSKDFEAEAKEREKWYGVKYQVGCFSGTYWMPFVVCMCVCPMHVRMYYVRMFVCAYSMAL